MRTPAYLLLPVLCAGALSVCAAAGESGGRERIRPEELNRAITEVMEKREFLWRLPRETNQASEEPGLLDAFFNAMLDTVKHWLEPVGRWIKKLVEWLIENFLSRTKTETSQDSLTALHACLYVLLAALAAVLAWLAWRLWRKRNPREILPVQAAPIVLPDLHNDDIAADQLPEDGWLKLAQELLQKGNLRLALRAFYLASLAHLGRRELLVIAKFKSNREYGAELTRRAREKPELLAAFAANVAIFERIWYGRHEALPEAVQDFRSNLARIQA
jgi:hypothetical protein